jgi:hypothetical protein
LPVRTMATLAFLAEPAFVATWYLVGAGGAIWVAYDLHRTNTALKQAMKWAWPIIVFFFSVFGLALYFLTARAPGVAKATRPEDKKRLHDAYERSMPRRVNGAVIHCVAGDGLGIMTAMVIARLTGMTFWQEFWFEYAVGFAFGLFIFQLKSMTMMTDSLGRALWMAFRAEFFSMLTVMGGMGAVMTYVTPLVVGAQPHPSTAAFWGFGAFGLLVGYLFTFPMNWMLVKVGWKHGMGSKEDVHPVKTQPLRGAIFASMAVLGVLALALPTWLTVQRQQRPLALDAATAVTSTAATAPVPPLQQTLDAARSHLAAGERADGVAALDAAMRAAMVLDAQDVAGAHPLLEAIRSARDQLQDGRPDASAQLLAAVRPPAVPPHPNHEASGRDYSGVPLIDVHGAIVGEVRQVRGDQVEVALGAAQDILGFWDRPDRMRRVPARDVLLGPRHSIGKSYAMLLEPVAHFRSRTL